MTVVCYTRGIEGNLMPSAVERDDVSLAAADGVAPDANQQRPQQLQLPQLLALHQNFIVPQQQQQQQQALSTAAAASQVFSSGSSEVVAGEHFAGSIDRASSADVV
jgi:hypothetical protein